MIAGENTLEGTWHIHEMDLWDKDYFNMQVQAFICIEPYGSGDFQFSQVSSVLDGAAVKTGNLERFEFTWEGQDENDPAFSSGWLKLSCKDKVSGSNQFHLGGRSAFLAVRADDIENSET